MNKKIISVVSIILVVAVMCTVLAACNAESVQKKLEKKGYEVEVATEDELSEFGEGFEVKWALTAFNIKEESQVSVTAYKKTDDAKLAEGNLKKAIEIGSEFGVKMVVKRSGKIVYYGTEQGVKDAK